MTYDKKKLALAVAGIIILLIVVVVLIKTTGSRKKTAQDVFQNEEIYPTVDSSVSVKLKPSSKKGEVVVEIKNAPYGTKTAEEIELTYQRERQTLDEGDDTLIQDGAIASCEFENGSRDCTTEEITLGTCSSGVCRYHKVVGKIKLKILFKGSYGKKIFEKDFSL